MKKNVFIGLVSFCLMIVIGIVVFNLFNYYSMTYKYRDIYSIADKYKKLSFSKIEDEGESGIEICFGDIFDFSADHMREFYDYSKDLEMYLNKHKEIFGEDETIRPVRLTFKGRSNRESSFTVAANSNADESNVQDYHFNTYYCYYNANFSDVEYLSDAKRLLFFYEVTDINDAEKFDDLEYLYIKISADEEEKLKGKLPNCNIDFERKNTQRTVFY